MSQIKIKLLMVEDVEGKQTLTKQKTAWNSILSRENQRELKLN